MAAHGFISFFYAVLECKQRQLTYCNAGHNPPILISGDSVRSLDCGGGILGVVEHWQYDDQELQLRSGGRLLMYTDGVTESRDSDGVEFGEDRLMDLVVTSNRTAVRVWPAALSMLPAVSAPEILRTT